MGVTISSRDLCGDENFLHGTDEVVVELQLIQQLLRWGMTNSGLVREDVRLLPKM